MSLFRAKTVQQRPLLPREVELSNRLAGLNEWNDVSEEVIDSKILVGLLKKPEIHRRYRRGASFWPIV